MLHLLKERALQSALELEIISIKYKRNFMVVGLKMFYLNKELK
jgi:hypothetical protein